MSVAIIATMTPSSGKKLLIQELNLNFFVREFGTVTTTAVVGMPEETARRGLRTEISLEIGFFFSGLSNYFQRLATYRNNKSPLTWKPSMCYLT